MNVIVFRPLGEEVAFGVNALGMPSHLMVNLFVIWRMDSVITVPLTQLEPNVNYVSQASLVTPQELQNVLVKHI